MSGSMPDILRRILASKREELETLLPLREDFRRQAADQEPPGDFPAALSKDVLAVIAEIKKASPSAGIISSDFNPAVIAEAYTAGGADAISVITDQQYFQGSNEILRQAKAKTNLPVLRKDFIIHPVQVFETRAIGADSFLLIVAALTGSELKDLLELGRELGMEALVEVHDSAELALASDVGAGIIGVNNRNLKSFITRLSLAEELFPEFPLETISVAESGIKSPEDARRMRRAGFSAILVGESLMREGPTACSQWLSQAKKDGKT